MIPTALKGRSELGVAALLGVVAVVVFVDAAGIHKTSVNAGVMGPQVVPIVISVGLVLSAIALAVDVLRGGAAEQEDGEDIDLAGGAHWPTLLGLAAIIAVTALLLEFLGFVIAMSLLFYGASLMLGSKRYVIGLGIAIALSLGTFYGFVLGLGISLPAGLLQGIL